MGTHQKSLKSNLQKSFNFYKNPKTTLKMVFTKFVEIGRIVYIKDSNQIAAVCDVVDQKHIIIDAPNVNRQKINLNRIELTKFKLEFLYGARTRTVNKAWAAADIDSQWAGSTWAKNIARKALRASASDFQRFKVMKLKQARRQIINSAK